jgi:hypothetical protein
MAMSVVPEKRKRGRPKIRGTPEATEKIAFTLPNYMIEWLDSKREPAKKKGEPRGRSKFVRTLLEKEMKRGV